MNPQIDAELSALPPGARTTLEVLLLEGAQVEKSAGCFVIRSPSQPGFYWGNCIYVTTGDVEDAEHWISMFHRSFPEADWLAICLPRVPKSPSWERVGLIPEVEDALALDGLPLRLPTPLGYEVRSFADQSDWDQLFDMDLGEQAADSAGVDADYEQFSRGREEVHKRLIGQGKMNWMGAFTSQGVLAASLGIALLGDSIGRARYQYVLTHPEHRKKGLAGALLGHAASWAHDRGAVEFFIVTDQNNPAGRLYRSVGFSPVSPSVTAYRGP